MEQTDLSKTNCFYSLDYEPCVMKELALPLLNKISETHEEYETVQRLISAVSRFETLDSDLIPDNSLIREFIGGGCFKY